MRLVRVGDKVPTIKWNYEKPPHSPMSFSLVVSNLSSSCERRPGRREAILPPLSLSHFSCFFFSHFVYNLEVRSTKHLFPPPACHSFVFTNFCSTRYCPPPPRGALVSVGCTRNHPFLVIETISCLPYSLSSESPRLTPILPIETSRASCRSRCGVL